jgi:hypothetical protein
VGCAWHQPTSHCACPLNFFACFQLIRGEIKRVRAPSIVIDLTRRILDTRHKQAAHQCIADSLTRRDPPRPADAPSRLPMFGFRGRGWLVPLKLIFFGSGACYVSTVPSDSCYSGCMQQCLHAGGWWEVGVHACSAAIFCLLPTKP